METVNPERSRKLDRPIYTPHQLDSGALTEYLQELCDHYPFFGVEYIGETILGRRIPAAVLGNGNTELLYLSGQHGSEWLTGLVLIRFLYELCEAFETGRKLYGCDTRYILSCKRLIVIPLLNIDGAELSLHGIEKDNPLAERLLRMNEGSTDFTRWQANARGVDIDYNYDALWMEHKNSEQENGITGGCAAKYSGTCPESEPETGAVAAYLRSHSFRSLLNLRTQGEQIRFSSLSSTPVGARTIASQMAAITGYKLTAPSGTAAYGSLLEWFIEQYDRPAFQLECGKGHDPLPLEEEARIYLRVRRALFSFPLMV